eukprot:Selendium_serpulae@DN4686_c0_g1_i1.p1
MKYTINDEALHTMLFHALKHHSCTVLGVVLGSFSDSDSVEISTVVPLLHTHILPSLLSLGFALVEEYCAITSTNIVGYYLSNGCDNATSTKLTDLMNQKIKTTNGKVVTLTINTTHLESGRPCAVVHYDGKLVGESGEGIAKQPEFSGAIENCSYLNTFDFDDHLAGHTVHFFNKAKA